MKQLMSKPPGSLSKPSDSKLRNVLNERVELSEAILIAGKIIATYPMTRKVGESYQGAIARVLCSYPAIVVRRAHLVPGGVPAQFSALPSPAHVIKWCEENTAPLRRNVEREERTAQQFAERDEREAKRRTPRGMAMTQAWLDRTDPVAAQLSGQDPRPSPPPQPEGSRRRYTYKEFLEWAKANGKPPRPIGVFETVRQVAQPTKEDIAAAKAKLIAEIGQEAFDAIPNAN